jgi:hypothetical protein
MLVEERNFHKLNLHTYILEYTYPDLNNTVYILKFAYVYS